MIANPSYLRPRDVATLLNVKVDAVLAWIHRGELQAVDVSQKRSLRPRWRISREGLDQFLATRVAAPARPPPRRRRQRDPNVIEYF